MQEGRDHLPRALRGQMGGGRVTFYIGIDYGLTINVGLLNVQQICCVCQISALFAIKIKKHDLHLNVKVLLGGQLTLKNT